jgi:hypothetical protein
MNDPHEIGRRLLSVYLHNVKRILEDERDATDATSTTISNSNRNSTLNVPPSSDVPEDAKSAVRPVWTKLPTSVAEVCDCFPSSQLKCNNPVDVFRFVVLQHSKVDWKPFLAALHVPSHAFEAKVVLPQAIASEFSSNPYLKNSLESLGAPAAYDSGSHSLSFPFVFRGRMMRFLHAYLDKHCKGRTVELPLSKFTRYEFDKARSAADALIRLVDREGANQQRQILEDEFHLKNVRAVNQETMMTRYFALLQQVSSVSGLTAVDSSSSAEASRLESQIVDLSVPPLLSIQERMFVERCVEHGSHRINVLLQQRPPGPRSDDVASVEKQVDTRKSDDHELARVSALLRIHRLRLDKMDRVISAHPRIVELDLCPLMEPLIAQQGKPAAGCTDDNTDLSTFLALDEGELPARMKITLFVSPRFCVVSTVPVPCCCPELLFEGSPASQMLHLLLSNALSLSQTLQR